MFEAYRDQLAVDDAYEAALDKQFGKRRKGQESYRWTKNNGLYNQETLEAYRAKIEADRKLSPRK